MPPAPTRPKLKHKSGRGDLEEFGFESSHAREIEQKRNSGQISCAECRRLKIKCDKQIPCQSCQRRGCAALCPNGSLSTGQGTRFVLAATEHLHLRMAKMSERIRQLEGALSVESTPELLEAFGTLSISNSGASRFFGPTGGSHVNCHLPSEERALYLTETYAEQASWLFQSVSKNQILLELLPAYYVNGASHITQTGNNPHRLCLLFLVFAIGALLDPNQELENVEADRYHQAARAAICLRSVMEKPSLETIQALHLLSLYNAVSGNEVTGKETSMETSWSLVTLAAHLAHTVNRDGLRWGLPADVTARRRVVFWDLFVADVWNCLEAGRPPTFSLPYIDCQFPGGGSPRDKFRMDTDSQAFCGSWVFRFASDCVAEVAARTLTSDSPSYSTILELDRKVCNFPVPEAVKEFVAAASGAIPTKPVDKDIGLMESMGRYVMSNSREVTIVENPVNPLNSPYTPSFLATYRASLTILRTVKMQYDLHPKLTARLWPIWTYAFSAAVVFGTIVTHGPRSPMATSAMKELRDAYLLFSKASSRNRRAQKALPIITKLMEKAQNALLRAQSDIPDELGQQWRIDENERDDELAIFAGRMKIVSMKGQATDRMPEQSSDGNESTKWLNGPASERQEKQVHVDPAVLQSYSREQLSSTWLQQPASTIGLEHFREMPNWERPRYPDAPSQSMLMQLPPMALQIHPAPVLSQVPVHSGPGPGSSTRALLSSDPYPMVSLSAPSTQGAGSHYHQSWAQAHESPSTHPHAQPHRRQPIDALPRHQPPHQRACPSTHPPTHPHPHELPPALPELSQLGLVGQESGLDRQWTSFMRESGFVP
ncbi:fungal-specific transcription factor domain-containing protein [Pisolithus sp. B1]|nr:fungal-specific transcription factor domain-containing protein [Pisolithus sp. B1]